MYVNLWIYWPLTAVTWIMIIYSLRSQRRTWRSMKRTDHLHAQTVAVLGRMLHQVTEAPHDYDPPSDTVTVALPAGLYASLAALTMTTDMIERDLKP